MIDVERLRAETPGCERVVHLNNCGASLQPRPVVDAVVDYLRAEELDGGYEIAADRADDLDRVYDATAPYLNCEPTELAFNQSAGDGWWREFSAVKLVPRDRILVGRSEYQANAFGWLQARERGVTVDVVPNNEFGEIDLDRFVDLVDERVKLVALTMISLGNGAVHPAAELGRRLRMTGSDAIYLLDACQAAGQLPLDVQTLGCDFLVYTGRKFMRGPRGTGVLYANHAAMDRLGPSPFVDGRSATWTSATSYELEPNAQRFEFGEYGFGAKVGLGVATEYMLDVGVKAIAARIEHLATDLRVRLESIAGVDVHDEGRQKCGIVTFTIDGLSADSVVSSLATAGINAGAPFRVPLHNSTSELETLRRSFALGVHCFNTAEELDRLASVVQDLTTNTRSRS